MPRPTLNSQVTPLVEVESDANRPSSCDVAGASASNASPSGDANASAATNPPSQPSPEFLATVVQAVKAALAAEQASVPCPASTALPNQGQSSSTASLSSAMAFGGVPSLLSSQASAFAASGAGFAAHSTSAGASAAQGRPALVVPTFVSTFLPPNPSHSLSIANMATTSSQDSVSSAATLPQANISSATSFPVLNQPFIVGPGFSPVPAKVVGHVVAGKFIDLGDLLRSTVVSAEPEPQLLFDGRLVLTFTPKKPKRRVEDIATWMEAFSVYCLIIISFFPHRSRDLLQYKLLILRTYRQFSGKVWLAYDRAFREHAAAANVVDWSSINVQLFNFHAAGASARGPNVSSPDSSEPAGASTSQILCKSWNKGRCVAPYASCRFAHRCSSCSGAHRAVNCPGSEPAQPPVKSSRRSRSPSRSSSKSRRT